MLHTAPPRRGALLLGFAALCTAGMSVPSAATAVPLVPGATPLAMVMPGLPSRCHTAGEFSGTKLQDAIQRQARRGGPTIYADLALFQTPPVVSICDPDMAAAGRFLGPITGETQTALPTDIAYLGLRAVGRSGTPADPAGLHPGDRLVLPTAGPRAVVDVAVRTVGGVRSVRVPGGPRPTVIQSSGTFAAPVLMIERESGPPTTIAVAARPRVPFKATTTLRRDELTLKGQASPGTLLIATAGPTTDTDLAASEARAVTTTSGRFRNLSVPLSRDTLRVVVRGINAVDRTSSTLICSVRWSRASRSATSVRCSTSDAGNDAPINGIGSQSRRSASSRPAPVASRAATGARRAPRPAPRAAGAGKKHKLQTVESGVTLLGRAPTDAEFLLAEGDLNLDGLPDASVLQRDPRRQTLHLSRAGGWTPVPVRLSRGDRAYTYPDLDGDGRGELSSSAGVVVTDAFGAGALPTALDLRTLRTPSPRDLDYGQAPDFAEFSLLDFSFPTGLLDDVTGDGRPETVFNFVGPIVVASEDAVPGRRSRLASITNFAFNAKDLDGPAYEFGFDSTTDQVDLDRQSGTNVSVGRMTTVAIPADGNRSPATPRPIELRAIDGRGNAVASRALVAAGIPWLTDTDLATGDALLVLWHPKPCTRRSPCRDRLLRVAPSGAVVSSVAFRRRSDDAALRAAFIADGPDADRAVDVAIWRDSGLLDALDDPSRAADAGTIGLLTSVTLGSVKHSAIPVLARRGEPVRIAGTPSKVVLPNGTRWFGAPLVPRGGTALSRRQELALIAQTG